MKNANFSWLLCAFLVGQLGLFRSAHALEKSESRFVNLLKEGTISWSIKRIVDAPELSAQAKDFPSAHWVEETIVLSEKSGVAIYSNYRNDIGLTSQSQLISKPAKPFIKVEFDRNRLLVTSEKEGDHAVGNVLRVLPQIFILTSIPPIFFQDQAFSKRHGSLVKETTTFNWKRDESGRLTFAELLKNEAPIVRYQCTYSELFDQFPVSAIYERFDKGKLFQQDEISFGKFNEWKNSDEDLFEFTVPTNFVVFDYRGEEGTKTRTPTVYNIKEFMTRGGLD